MGRSNVGLRGGPGPAGQPAEVLVEESATRFCLIVGSRGLGGFRGLLLGSVSEQCAQHAHRPIVIVARTCLAIPDSLLEGSICSAEVLDEADHAAARVKRGASTRRAARKETRGIGVEELALALDEGRPHRANAALAVHVLQAAEAAIASAYERRFVELSSEVS